MDPENTLNSVIKKTNINTNANKTNILNIIKQKNVDKDDLLDFNNYKAKKYINSKSENREISEVSSQDKKAFTTIFTAEKSKTKNLFSNNENSNKNYSPNKHNKHTYINRGFYGTKTSNKNENENEIIVVIIRHGERADLAGEEIKYDLYDSELTAKGIKQAYEAGYRLKEILDLLKPQNKKIAILTSPFSRCIMTAKYVKNGMNYNLPLFLENGLCEFINLQWFRESPNKFLCYLNLNNLLFQELSNEIIIDKSLVPLPEFPESTHKCTERFNKAFEMIIQQYAIKTGFNVIIMVTHFFGIQCLCEKMNIPLDNFDIEYCSTFVFKFNKDNNEFKFENNFYPIDEDIY